MPTRKRQHYSKNDFITFFNQFQDLEEICKYTKCTRKELVYDGLNENIIIHKNGILTEEDVKYICDNYTILSSRELSEKYNCSISTITNLWKKHDLKNKIKHVYSLDENYFSKIDTDIKAYFLGFIAADGCIHKNESKQDILKICISKKDEELLIKFKEELKTNKPLSYRNGKYVTLEISSDKIVKDLGKYNLVPNKTYKDIVSDNLPSKFVLSFIRGYTDGDGCVHKDSWDIAGYETNLRKIKEQLSKYNILADITIDKRKYSKNEFGDIFGRVGTTNKTQSYSILKLLYDNNNFSLTRKKEKALDFIREIEKSNNNRDKQIVIYYNYAVLPLS